MPRQSAATQDEVCAGVAPSRRVASTMMASVPPNPTNAATSADAITENCNPCPPPAIVTRAAIDRHPAAVHRSPMRIRGLFRFFERLVPPTGPVPARLRPRA